MLKHTIVINLSHCELPIISDSMAYNAAMSHVKLKSAPHESSSISGVVVNDIKLAISQKVV